MIDIDKNNLESLWQKKPNDFVQLMGQDPQRFWDRVSPEDPRLTYMQGITCKAGWQEVCYPIILHGDGGVYTKNNASSILTVSIKSLLSRSFSGNVIPCFCLPKHIRCHFKFVIMKSPFTLR